MEGPGRAPSFVTVTAGGKYQLNTATVYDMPTGRLYVSVDPVDEGNVTSAQPMDIFIRVNSRSMNDPWSQTNERETRASIVYYPVPENVKKGT